VGEEYGVKNKLNQLMIGLEVIDQNKTNEHISDEKFIVLTVLSLGSV
jgi:hypothetical protein